MLERTPDPKRRQRRWLSTAIVGLFLASSVLAFVLVATPASGANAPEPANPILSGGPSCTITVNTEDQSENAIQAAIDTYGPESSPGSPVTICVGSGSFPEQLTINGTTDLTILGDGNASTILDPATVSENGLDLGDGGATASIVGAANDAGLTVENLGIDGSSAGAALFDNCGLGFVGINFEDSTGTISGVSVSDVNNDGGCQTQLGIYVENSYLDGGGPSSLAVQIVDSTVSAYGKNGITCNGLGITCDVDNDTVATSPMGPGYAATNGIQFWAATGTIEYDQVSGNNYTLGICAGENYFFTWAPTGPCGTDENNYTWSAGILLLQAPASVLVAHVQLIGNQVGIWSFGGPVQVWTSTIESGYYGIVFDNSSADAVGPDLAPSNDQERLADGNTITGANVGVLVYDDNASLSLNTISGSSVAIEVQTDENAPYVDLVVSNDGSGDVSGALLGDVSSYQPGDLAPALPTAAYSVSGNVFTNSSSVASSGTSYGIYIYGASAYVGSNQVNSFANGISVVLGTDGSAFVASNQITGPAVLTAGAGLYAFAYRAIIEDNAVYGYSWSTGPGWWPDSQSAGIYAACEVSCQIVGNTALDDSIGIAVLSYGYGPNPAPSWPYVDPPSAGPVTVADNTVVDSNAFGVALELNQFANTPTSAPAVTVSGNTVDNTLSGAVGLMVDQGVYTISGNTFIGTSASSATGPGQPTGEGTAGTASIQVLNAYDSDTIALVGANTYEDTDLFTSLLNVTSTPGDFATIIGSPTMGAPSAPGVSATEVDVDQSLSVSGAIPSSGAPGFNWTWLVSVNGAALGPATQCDVGSGAGELAGDAVVCAIAAGQLTAGDQYRFVLVVGDSSTDPVVLGSLPSSTVTVSEMLTAPPTPVPSAPLLDADQPLTVGSSIPETGSPSYAWTWLVSIDGTTPVAASACTPEGGTGASAGAAVTCAIAGGTLPSGSTDAFALQVTDAAGETTTSSLSSIVTVASALGTPTTPTLIGTAFDVNEAVVATSSFTSTGTEPYAWQWLVSVNDLAPVPMTLCAVNSGTSAVGTTVTCAVPAGKLTAGDSYAFELEVHDSATSPEYRTSATSATVHVTSELKAPGRPTVNHPALDANQALTVSGKLPTTGTPPYAWTWLVSADGGAFGPTGLCAKSSGTGGAAGATVTCVIAAGHLVAGDYYNFELKVTDSATPGETKTSSPTLDTVTVSAKLVAPSAPGVSATKLDVNQALTVSDSVPTTGTSPYAWTWLVAVDGGSYVAATFCAPDAGTGANAGETVSCTVPANSLTVGDHYAFKLKVTDGATVAESATSTASSGVTVKSALTSPAAPSVSYTRMAVAQTLTVTGKLPTTGTGPYQWQWEVSVNGDGYSSTMACAVSSGSGGSGGSTVTCSIAGGTLTSGDTYAFVLVVTDSATSHESEPSGASHLVTVA